MIDIKDIVKKLESDNEFKNQVEYLISGYNKIVDCHIYIYNLEKKNLEYYIEKLNINSTGYISNFKKTWNDRLNKVSSNTYLYINMENSNFALNVYELYKEFYYVSEYFIEKKEVLKYFKEFSSLYFNHYKKIIDNLNILQNE